MNDKKIDGKEISLIARKYFEEVFRTPYIYFEVLKANFDNDKKVWVVEVEVNPLYSTEKKTYRLEIGEEGGVINVEQAPAP